MQTNTFFDLIDTFPGKCDWDALSRHPQLTLSMVEKHQKEQWNWDRLSIRFPLLVIKSRASWPWSWNIISRRRDLTPEFIGELIDKDWDWSRLCITMQGRIRVTNKFKNELESEVESARLKSKTNKFRKELEVESAGMKTEEKSASTDLSELVVEVPKTPRKNYEISHNSYVKGKYSFFYLDQKEFSRKWMEVRWKKVTNLNLYDTDCGKSGCTFNSITVIPIRIEELKNWFCLLPACKRHARPPEVEVTVKKIYDKTSRSPLVCLDVERHYPGPLPENFGEYIGKIQSGECLLRRTSWGENYPRQYVIMKHLKQNFIIWSIQQGKVPVVSVHDIFNYMSCWFKTLLRASVKENIAVLENDPKHGGSVFVKLS